MARLCLVEAEHVPVYCHYFDITLIPATVFFVNGQHMKVDYGCAALRTVVESGDATGLTALLCRASIR